MKFSALKYFQWSDGGGRNNNKHCQPEMKLTCRSALT